MSARVTAVRAWPFAIPFEPPLELAGGTVEEHCGVVVEVKDRYATGYGEIAPGPGTSREQAIALTAQVNRLAGIIADYCATVVERREGSPSCPIPRGLKAGVEAAAFDRAARMRGEPLHRILDASGGIVDSLEVNAMIDRGDSTDRLAAIDAAIGRGYRCLKIKVGSNDFDSCVDSIRRLRERDGTSVAIRLDCNGEWSLDEGRKAIERLASLSIEYIEQPARKIEDLAALRKVASIPIAADESVSSLEEVKSAIACKAVDVLVLKPARLGLTDSLTAASIAQAAGIDCVVTSNLESSLGIAATLQVAAIVDASQPSRRRAHGLATAGLLADDLVEARLLPRNGRLTVPTGPGVGLVPAATSIARSRIDSGQDPQTRAS